MIKDIQKAKQDMVHAGEKTYLIMGDYPQLQSLVNSTLDQKHVYYLTILPHNTQVQRQNMQTILIHYMNQESLVLFKKVCIQGCLVMTLTYVKVQSWEVTLKRYLVKVTVTLSYM